MKYALSSYSARSGAGVGSIRRPTWAGLFSGHTGFDACGAGGVVTTPVGGAVAQATGFGLGLRSINITNVPTTDKVVVGLPGASGITLMWVGRLRASPGSAIIVFGSSTEVTTRLILYAGGYCEMQAYFPGRYIGAWSLNATDIWGRDLVWVVSVSPSACWMCIASLNGPPQLLSGSVFSFGGSASPGKLMLNNSIGYVWEAGNGVRALAYWSCPMPQAQILYLATHWTSVFSRRPANVLGARASGLPWLSTVLSRRASR